MIKYLAGRFILTAFMLFGVICITFVISNVAPTDPAALAAGPDAGPDEIEQIRRDYGLDQPLGVQFVNYVGRVVRFDFGQSVVTGRSVNAEVARFFPATLQLCILAMLLGVGLGMPLGMLGALYKDRLPDHLIRVFAVSGLALPTFWFGLLLQLFFATWLGILPTSGQLSVITIPPDPITGMIMFDALLTGQWSLFRESLSYTIMPAIVLSLPCMASIMRVTRSEMVETLRADYSTSARAHGVSQLRIVSVHALKNAMLPILALIGLRWGWMMSSTVLVETVFDYPGIGLYVVSSVITGDFQPVMAATLVISLNFMLANLLVDLAYGILDPRLARN